MVGRRRGRSRPFADFLHRHYPNLARVVAREIVETANVLRDRPLLGRPLAGHEHERQIVVMREDGRGGGSRALLASHLRQ